MLKFLFGAGIALGLALAGCNSFNKTTYSKSIRRRFERDRATTHRRRSAGWS
ncbi:hypothetical protein AWB81_01807 [Caballeronia arationis]|nr:hypothetical protein AWB81_01807 [Caballeronia arationis]